VREGGVRQPEAEIKKEDILQGTKKTRTKATGKLQQKMQRCVFLSNADVIAIDKDKGRSEKTSERNKKKEQGKGKGRRTKSLLAYG